MGACCIKYCPAAGDVARNGLGRCRACNMATKWLSHAQTVSLASCQIQSLQVYRQSVLVWFSQLMGCMTNDAEPPQSSALQAMLHPAGRR